MEKFIVASSLLFFLIGCSSSTYNKTVDKVEIERFMGTWYVIAGRFTFLEKEVHNAVEIYSWNEAKQRIDIDFRFNKGSLNGPVKEIPQTATIVTNTNNAKWKVSPFWPLKFDYLVVALDPEYQWTAIGVPSQNYLWIMARSKDFTKEQVQQVVAQLRLAGYDSDNLVFVPHSVEGR